MSGHSKWASIQQAETDAKRGQLFTKLARAMAVAAREGGGDPESNFTLAAAIEKAKGSDAEGRRRARDRPRERRGQGDEQYEAPIYEGYGPGGAAASRRMTDNRNRTGPEIRQGTFLDRHGGNLGEPGSSWRFDKKGVIIVDGDRSPRTT